MRRHLPKGGVVMPVGNVVYVSGALTDVPTETRPKYIAFYEDLGRMINNLGLTAYVPHWNTDPVKHKDVTPRQVDLIDRTAVTSAMLVLVVADNPSLGVGIEVEMAYHAGKPVVLLASSERVERRLISRLVRGNPSVTHEILYSTFEQGVQEAEAFIRHFLEDLSQSVLPTILMAQARSS